MVVFQIIFCIEIYVNDVFLFFKKQCGCGCFSNNFSY